MNLFIETPQREAERLAYGRRPAPATMPPAGTADYPASAPRLPPSQTGPMPRWMIAAQEGERYRTEAASPPAADEWAYGGAAARQGPARGRGYADPYGGGAPYGAPYGVPDWERYSLGQEMYRDELAYDRMRASRRRRNGALRVIALIVVVPLMLALAFVVSYVLTCILNGASPDDIAGLLADLADRVGSWIADFHPFG